MSLQFNMVRKYVFKIKVDATMRRSTIEANERRQYLSYLVVFVIVDYQIPYIIMFRLYLIVLSVLVFQSRAFTVFNTKRVVQQRSTISWRRLALPSPEESAQALTDYMAKSHEEKIKALATVEKKYKDRIAELELKVQQLEGKAPRQTSFNSVEMPATNKSLTKMVGEYKRLLSNYLVNAQKEKVQAVATAEQKLKDHYEAILAQQKSEDERPVPESTVGAPKEVAPAELSGKDGFQ